jgi:small subunit ribosomal protein S23e
MPVCLLSSLFYPPSL